MIPRPKEIVQKENRQKGMIKKEWFSFPTGFWEWVGGLRPQKGIIGKQKPHLTLTSHVDLFL